MLCCAASSGGRRWAQGGQRLRVQVAQSLTVRERIAQGGESRWIDLRGGERCIKAIGLIGDTERSRDQARVDVYGR